MANHPRIIDLTLALDRVEYALLRRPVLRQDLYQAWDDFVELMDETTNEGSDDPIDVVEKVVELLHQTLPALGNGKQDGGRGLETVREGLLSAYIAIVHGMTASEPGYPLDEGTRAPIKRESLKVLANRIPHLIVEWWLKYRDMCSFWLDTGNFIFHAKPAMLLYRAVMGLYSHTAEPKPYLGLAILPLRRGYRR